MPLPIVWLGAAAVSALAANALSNDRKKQQIERFSLRDTTYNIDDSFVVIPPSDLFATKQRVAPELGSIVCCGIGGILEHTGIWAGERTIIEMDGNGLIRAVSLERFIEKRSGRNVFVACDSTGKSLALMDAAERAISQIFSCQHYDIINNNCHQFVWQCFMPEDKRLTTFNELNRRISQYFNRKIYWDLCIK